ncbi:hypothetical protein TrispH2_002966 [Trichoplax sp. H2]|nr:hypothetical protein TrispH2_002966 [Trichoplax sp. H2]|eukprot:RDD45071.1 hypothetical protein TrispH2_002966 [Trichoplax sp. H2]
MASLATRPHGEYIQPSLASTSQVKRNPIMTPLSFNETRLQCKFGLSSGTWRDNFEEFAVEAPESVQHSFADWITRGCHEKPYCSNNNAGVLNMKHPGWIEGSRI